MLACPSDALSARRASQTWAMLIKRVYEVDPLACPKCGGQMKVVAFIEPPQGAVIEKILRHCGLWHASSPRPPPWGSVMVYVPDDDGDGDTAFFDGAGGVDFRPRPGLGPPDALLRRALGSDLRRLRRHVRRELLKAARYTRTRRRYARGAFLPPFGLASDPPFCGPARVLPRRPTGNFRKKFGRNSGRGRAASRPPPCSTTLLQLHSSLWQESNFLSLDAPVFPANDHRLL